MKKRILALNPGGSSTKFAVYDDDVEIFRKNLEHHGPELAGFPRVADQADFRMGLIRGAVAEAGIPLQSLDAVVGRGGMLKPLGGGAYEVNAAMLEDLRQAKRGEHASNLGAMIADALAREIGVKAYIVDPVSVDEMEPEARISGSPELPRESLLHALNSKAVGHRVADMLGKRYEELNLVVAHLGSGISVSPHRRGRMIDVNNAREEGPMAPDRCGGLPARKLIKLCFSGKYTEEEMLAMTISTGGMVAYLGTKDTREAERRAAAGDAQADLVLRAMAYQIAKEIGAMAAVLAGQVDRIIITGGIAYSQRIVEDISARVRFIAPIVVLPGEEELPALAAGTLRVLRGEETSHIY